MDFKNKSNSWQALWVAAGSFSSFAFGIISAAILSRLLLKEDYGTYKQIIYVYSILLLIFSAGLPRVFSYFLPRFSIEEGKSIVNKVTGLLLVIGFIFSLFLYLGSDLIAEILNNAKLSNGLKIFSPIPFFLLPTLGIEGIFSTYKKSIFIAIYNVLTRFIVLLGILSFVFFFEKSYEFAIYGWVIASFFSLLIALYFKNLPFKNVISRKAKLSYKEIFRYSLPLMYASIWGIAIKAADQFFISRYYGEEVFAEYSNGFIQIPLVGMITSSASVVLMPIFSRIFNNNDDPSKELLPIWRNAIKKSAMLIYPMVVFFIVFSDDIMILLYSEKYIESATYFSISVLVNFFNIIIFAPLFLASGNTKIYAKIHLFIAITVWLSGFTIVYFFTNPLYIASNSVFFEIVKIIVLITFAAKILRINAVDFFPLKIIGKIIILSGICIFPCYLISKLLINYFEFYRIINIILILLSYIVIYFIGANFLKLDYSNLALPFIKKIK